MNHEASKIIDLYRRHAFAWTTLRGPELKEQAWLTKFRANLPDSPSVVDVGCGSGLPIGRYLIKSGCRLTGVDASPELIEIARKQLLEAEWRVDDMRNLKLETKFDGLVAWHSMFHLTPDDQRAMFPVFQAHAAKDAVLMFTSGSEAGVAIGDFEGEPLYHSSLDAAEYRDLLTQHGFSVLEHVVEDPDCGLATIWLAKFR